MKVKVLSQIEAMQLEALHVRGKNVKVANDGTVCMDLPVHRVNTAAFLNNQPQTKKEVALIM